MGAEKGAAQHELVARARGLGSILMAGRVLPVESPKPFPFGRGAHVSHAAHGSINLPKRTRRVPGPV